MTAEARAHGDLLIQRQGLAIGLLQCRPPSSRPQCRHFMPTERRIEAQFVFCSRQLEPQPPHHLKMRQGCKRKTLHHPGGGT